MSSCLRKVLFANKTVKLQGWRSSQEPTIIKACVHTRTLSPHIVGHENTARRARRRHAVSTPPIGASCTPNLTFWGPKADHPLSHLYPNACLARRSSRQTAIHTMDCSAAAGVSDTDTLCGHANNQQIIWDCGCACIRASPDKILYQSILRTAWGR